MDQKHIRNFCIVAHIDHGKSTLADRLLDLTGAVSAREKKEQFLDKMDLERERGITIKASAARLLYKDKDTGETYELNLIDTPGHVDFTYEVSRSLKACEGAILVVDAAQGVEAQTLTNVYMAIDAGLEVLPVLNKIDLPAAEPARVRKEIEDVIGIDAAGALEISAKSGFGVPEVLKAVVERLPPPKGDPKAPLRALIIDSWFDSYQGVVCLVRVMDGRLEVGDEIRLINTGKEFGVTTLGYFSPHAQKLDVLDTGEVGFLTAAIKSVQDARVGDTITHVERPADKPLPGFKEPMPMVFAGIFPIDSAQYEALKDALSKLQLNDASLQYEPETSSALGFGFRCGFLGLLHMEIIQERLEREFELELITTAPSVRYQVRTIDGAVTEIHTPSALPDAGRIAAIEEPYIRANLYCPSEQVGAVIKLCEERRGIQKEIKYLTPSRTVVVYDLPFAEVVLDFYDRLKSVTRGYASLDYQPIGNLASDLVRLNILVNGEPVDALSLIVHRDKAYYKGRDLVKKMREMIPRQMFDVAIQAAIGSRVIARETVKAYRKNVTAKCYGGDITRKRKLLEKQKEGKKRMKQVGTVEIPQEAFLAVLKVES